VPVQRSLAPTALVATAADPAVAATGSTVLKPARGWQTRIGAFKFLSCS